LPSTCSVCLVPIEFVMIPPLTGIVVVELGTSVAGPFGAQILGDLGATIIKVENPETGDDARGWGPPFWHGAAATFQSLNRNKSSVAVDLKDADHRKKLRDFIISDADIVLQNLRPGLVARFGLDHTLIEQKPTLIYCNLGSFGDRGPLRDQPGYDPLMQAFGGIMSITGEAKRPPVRVGPSIIDMGAGMWCVVGILAALAQRAQTGKGCRIDTSLFETALAWMTIPAATTLASGREPGRMGTETSILAPYKAFKASDKYLIIAAGNDNLFRRLCEVLGRKEWAADPRFQTNSDRVTNRVVLNDLIDQIVASALCAEWAERLSAVGVPCAPLQSVKEVLAHPQTVALEMLRVVPDADMTLMSVPLRFDGERLPFRSRPPELGEDTDDILKPRR
jgi:crotonobetainyl-CoA:carnitine CoA-transferase CaiB-like acyl-CoA transferase